MRYRTLGTSCALAALLLTCWLARPAHSAETGTTVRTVAGATMTIGGMVMVPLAVEWGLGLGSEDGAFFLGWTAPILLAPGIPTLIEGLMQMGGAPSAVVDSGLVGPWGRARMARWSPIYVLAGGLAASLGLTAAVGLASTGEYTGVPALVLPMVGLGVFGAGIGLTIDGERAISQHPELTDHGPDDPGVASIKTGIAMFSMGAGVLALGSLSARFLMIADPGLSPWTVVVPAAMGVGYMVGGVAMLIGGVQRKARGPNSATASRSPLRLRVSGIAPSYDPINETVSLSVTGFTW